MSIHTIQPCYDRSDQITVRDLKRLIWPLVGGQFDGERAIPNTGNMYWLLIAKQRVGFEDNGSLYQYEKLYKECKRMRAAADQRRVLNGSNKFVEVTI